MYILFLCMYYRQASDPISLLCSFRPYFARMQVVVVFESCSTLDPGHWPLCHRQDDQTHELEFSCLWKEEFRFQSTLLAVLILWE